MRLKKSLITLTLLPLLTSCALMQRDEPPIVTVPVRTPVYQPEKPRKTNLINIEWFVLTQETWGQLVGQAESQQNAAPVFFALTPNDYENLAFNTQELLRYIQQQQQIILYYEEATSNDEE